MPAKENFVNFFQEPQFSHFEQNFSFLANLDIFRNTVHPVQKFAFSQASAKLGNSPSPDISDPGDDVQSSTVSQTTASPSNVAGEASGPIASGPRVIPIPKWRVLEEQPASVQPRPTSVDRGGNSPTTSSAPKRRFDPGSLDPKSKKGRVTLQTNDGPIEVGTSSV